MPSHSHTLNGQIIYHHQEIFKLAVTMAKIPGAQTILAAVELIIMCSRIMHWLSPCWLNERIKCIHRYAKLQISFRDYRKC
jgi:hypothetical protein